MFKKIKLFLFQNQNLRQTIAKNTFWLSFGELVGRVLRVGVVIYAARVLGAEGWGIFSYAITFAAMFTIFSDIGLSSVLTREVARDLSNRDRYFSTIFIIKSLLIFASFLIVLFVMPGFSRIPLSQPIVFFVALILIFDSLRNLGNAFFRATEKMEREALINIVTQGVILVAGMFVLFKYPSPENLALTYAIGSASGLLISVFFLWPFFKKIFSRFDKTLLKPIITTAWPFALGGILGAIMINTDTIMIGWFKGAQEVGFYAAAQKPILFIYVFSGFIAGAIFPALARFAQKDNERFRFLLEKGLSLVFLLALPFSVGIFLIAPQLIYLLYGSEYQPAITALQILAATIITAYSSGIITNSIFAYNRQKILIGYAAIGALGNVILNALFIPLWGIEGAAISTVFTQILSIGYAWKKMKEINNFSIFKSVKKPFIAALIMGGTVIFFQWLKIPLLVTIPLAAFVYFGALIIFKEKLFGEIWAIIEI